MLSLLFVCRVCIITGLWPYAFSFGWALTPTGLISWVAFYCLQGLWSLLCKLPEICQVIVTIVATRCQISRLRCTTFDFAMALPQTTMGELTALFQAPSWRGGTGMPLPKTLALGVSGLDIRPFGPRYAVPLAIRITPRSRCARIYPVSVVS